MIAHRHNGNSPAGKKYVLIIPDGGGDLHRVRGLSPMAEADTPFQDWVANEGVCGLMQTLYEDLPRGSIVAQLGMLGWDPRGYGCLGRATWEILGLGTVQLNADDLVFRANLVRMEGTKLASYNADFILTEQALPWIDRLNSELRPEFPEIELHHNSDFRNSLLVRGAGVDPLLFTCSEPHECEGSDFDTAVLISGSTPESRAVADRINRYLLRASEILIGGPANQLFPWSACTAFSLPSFRENTGFDGEVGIVGCVDFLRGFAMVGGVDFFKVGNGRPDTDYAAKGEKALGLLEAGYSFVVCHVNAPDEAAHMHDRRLKVRCLEEIDRHIVGPIVRHFQRHPEELGGLIVAPDHYTNLQLESTRAEAHSLHPVPFALWNGRDRDGVRHFTEEAARWGTYGAKPVSHLDLLSLLGVRDGRSGARPTRLVERTETPSSHRQTRSDHNPI